MDVYILVYFLTFLPFFLSRDFEDRIHSEAYHLEHDSLCFMLLFEVGSDGGAGAIYWIGWKSIG